jgi:Protein kinase domain
MNLPNEAQQNIVQNNNNHNIILKNNNNNKNNNHHHNVPLAVPQPSSSSSPAVMPGQCTHLVKLKCNPKLTGSYGTLFSFYDDASRVIKPVWDTLRSLQDHFDILNEHKMPYTEKFKGRVMETLAVPENAVKIIKVHLEVPKKHGYTSFIEETSKIKLVRDALGDNFARFSFIKCVGKRGPFAFILRSKDPNVLQFQLEIGDKVYKTMHLYMILQEKGEADLRTKLRTSPESVSLMQLDKDVRLFFSLIHEKHLVHKDLKPANIVYFPNAEVKFKVIDYGLCSDLKDPVASWKAKGTPGYMSPIFLLSNHVSMARINEHYINKRIHATFYTLAIEKYKEVYGDTVGKNQIPDDLYRIILRKNDEFAYAIILLELQFMSKKKLFLKNRLSSLLSYTRYYF